MKTLLLLIALSAACCGPAGAQLVGENLLVAMPEGYKVGFSDKKERLIMQEMVPAAETVEAWTEMVTVQIFLGMKGIAPERYSTSLQSVWAKSCPNATSQPVASGSENNYPFTLWLSSCPLNAATGKREIAWFKAIAGNDSFYLVQKAFKFQPSKEQIDTWMAYFKKVSVCDSRLTDRRCPSLKN